MRKLTQVKGYVATIISIIIGIICGILGIVLNIWYIWIIWPLAYTFGYFIDDILSKREKKETSNG